MKTRFWGVVLSICLIGGIPALALGEYPEREINIYCGSSAGGVTDLGIRLLAETVSKAFGQPVVVSNKPGASHTLCANLVANAKPDGYTLGALAGSAFTQVPNMRKVPYDTKKDFSWVASYTDYTSGLVVRNDAPWKTLEEFLDYSKKNPGKMIYGSDGFGLGTHILMEYLAVKKGGIDWKHVPIPGGPKLAAALLGGHIQAWSAAGTHVKFIKEGKIRLLVSFNSTRLKYSPDVPTLTEAGYQLELGTPLVIIGPKDLPAPVVKKLEGAFLTAMKEPSYLQFLDRVDFVQLFRGSEDLAKAIELQSKGWGELIQMTGIKPGK